MTTRAWFEDDELWRLLEPVIFSEGQMAAAPAEIENLLKLAPVPPEGRVLDVPCGPGRHTRELARRGFRVTGVDLTERYLNRAREATREMWTRVHLIKGDMRNPVSPGGFDLVINLFTSFGYFDDPEDDRRTLRAFHQSLRSGGFLVMDLVGREIVARTFRERDWRELPDGTLFLERRSLEGNWTRIHNDWILIRGADRTTCTHTLRLFTGSELADLLADAGFVDVRILGSLTGAPYDHAASRLVAVAQRA